MLLDVKKDFSRFLGMAPGRLHFAAHSHHFWPDASYNGHKQAWEDAALYADKKWSKVFAEVMPAVRAGIAGRLSLSNPNTIVFAPNTHEFIMRLLSCFSTGKRLRILTTDSEFYSFRRQLQRLAEDAQVDVTYVPTEPFYNFEERFLEAAARDHYDLIFFSHVFFNSGFVFTGFDKVPAVIKNKDTHIVMDGYHGFMAVPTDLSAVQSRMFYIAGGYKYAMSGEGACFMHCPDGYGLRPRNTGWFAEMDSLAAQKTGTVDYESGGARFFGATFDPSGLYRMRAVFDWLDERGFKVSDIHKHVCELQELFLEKISLQGLMVEDAAQRGHFLTFVRDDAERFEKSLLEDNIIIDRRNDRLRFGFGIYQDRQDVLRLAERLHGLT